MTVIAAIGYLKKWVRKTITGMGALKGSPAKIKSVVPTYSTLDPSVVLRNQVTMEWDSNNSPAGSPVWHEEKFFVVDNARQIYNIEEIPSKRTGTDLYYEVTYYDGSVGHFYIPMSSSQLKRKVVTSLPLPEIADLSTIYMIEDPLQPGTYQQYISTYDEDLKKYVWVSLGSTATDLSAYLKKIDATVITRTDYPNPDQETKVLYPTAASAPGAINEFQTMIGATSKYDYTNNKINTLTTHDKTNLVSAINEMGNLENLEMWDATTQTPATLVDAINISHASYDLVTQTTIDRTKYIKQQQMTKDNHDGSPIVNIGDPIDVDRVDVVKRATPESSTDYVDYRTYDVKVGGNLYDPNDPIMQIFGQVHIPQIKIKKDAPVYEDVVDTITPATWVLTAPSNYTADITLTHIPKDGSAITVVLNPATGGTITLTTTSGKYEATIVITGASTAPVAGTTVATITYKGESQSIAARYFLEIEGKDYSSAISGDLIEIGKDSFLYAVTVKVCTEEGKPLPELHINDKYIDMDFVKSDGSHVHCYIAVKDLIHESEGKDAIDISYDSTKELNIVSLVIDPDLVTYPGNISLGQTATGLHIMKANSTDIGVTRFATDAEVLAADSQYNAVRPFDIHEFLNKSDTVKDDLDNFYKDTTTGEIVNNTTIKAINELATETIVKDALAADKDVATYTYERIPVTGEIFTLSKIHDIEQVYQVDALSTVVNPQAYEIYYLSQIDGTNLPGLYVYDVVNAKWVRADGQAIVDVSSLPDPATSVIDAQSIYRLNDNRTLLARYRLSDAAVLAGYYIDDIGLKNDTTTPQVNVTWQNIHDNWSTYLNDEFVADTNGPVFALQDPISMEWVLIYNYVSEDGTLWHFYNNAWQLISIEKITEEDIKNTSRDYLLI